MGKYTAWNNMPESVLGARPKVAAMLDAGVPRCWIMILFLMAYMTNIDTWIARKSDKQCNLKGMFVHVWSIVLVSLIHRPWLETCKAPRVQDIDACEIFSGVGSITAALRDRLMLLVSIDFLQSSSLMHAGTWLQSC